jgi:hypothetical protein
VYTFHEHVELGGVDQVIKLAHVQPCHSRAFFLVAYPRESRHTFAGDQALRH